MTPLVVSGLGDPILGESVTEIYGVPVPSRLLQASKLPALVVITNGHNAHIAHITAS